MNRKQELVRNWMIPKHLKTLHHSDCQHHPAGDSSSLAHGSFMLAAKKGRWIGYLPRPLSLWLFSLISSPPSQSMSSTISKKNSSAFWLDLKCYWWPLAVISFWLTPLSPLKSLIAFQPPQPKVETPPEVVCVSTDVITQCLLYCKDIFWYSPHTGHSDEKQIKIGQIQQIFILTMYNIG